MCALCFSMEFIALGVHFATKQDAGYGTTSACYFASQNTIYVTCQKIPQSYVALPMLGGLDSVKEATVALAQWMKGGPMTREMQRKVKDLAVFSRHTPPSTFSLKKPTSREGIYLANAWIKACWGAGMMLSKGKDNLEEFAQDEESERIGQVLWGRPIKVKIITDADIFAAGQNAEAGFHGESRIIRYLMIKFIRKQMARKAITLEDGTRTDSFERWIRGQLHMGSNRPACLDCATYMRQIRIHFESRRGQASASGHAWVHPATLSSNRNKPTNTDVAAEAHLKHRAENLRK